MAKLGVNIDHVATVRQDRRTYEPDPVWAANLRWLAGYRHPWFAVPDLEERPPGKSRDPRLKYGGLTPIRAEHRPAYGRIDQFCDRGRRGVSQGRSIPSAVAAPSGRRAGRGRRVVGGGGQRDEICPGRL